MMYGLLSALCWGISALLAAVAARRIGALRTLAIGEAVALAGYGTLTPCFPRASIRVGKSRTRPDHPGLPAPRPFEDRGNQRHGQVSHDREGSYPRNGYKTLRDHERRPVMRGQRDSRVRRDYMCNAGAKAFSGWRFRRGAEPDRRLDGQAAGLAHVSASGTLHFPRVTIPAAGAGRRGRLPGLPTGTSRTPVLTAAWASSRSARQCVTWCPRVRLAPAPRG
jgi:hypothetical protein